MRGAPSPCSAYEHVQVEFVLSPARRIAEPGTALEGEAPRFGEPDIESYQAGSDAYAVWTKARIAERRHLPDARVKTRVAR